MTLIRFAHKGNTGMPELRDIVFWIDKKKRKSAGQNSDIWWF
jgi:hypothetical protein